MPGKASHNCWWMNIVLLLKPVPTLLPTTKKCRNETYQTVMNFKILTSAPISIKGEKGSPGPKGDKGNPGNV